MSMIGRPHLPPVTERAGDVVLECDVDLSPIAVSPGDTTVDELVTHHKAIVGEQDDWHGSRRAQVAFGRLGDQALASCAYDSNTLAARVGRSA